MGQTDRRSGVFYDRQKDRKAEMEALRDILRASPLDETFKWRQPCYTWEGANVVMPAAYAAHSVLSFFKGVLLDDPGGLLHPPGENSRSVRQLQFTDAAEITAARPAIEAFIAAAIELEKAGATVDLPDDDFDVTSELTDRLDADPAFREAWEALTPGRRRGWALHFSAAKKPETRTARIDKAAPKIAAGKGMHDR